MDWWDNPSADLCIYSLFLQMQLANRITEATLGVGDAKLIASDAQSDFCLCALTLYFQSLNPVRRAVFFKIVVWLLQEC